eukprot:Ihof_evm11s33 gene=Ihof_evmTU11s33
MTIPSVGTCRTLDRDRDAHLVEKIKDFRLKELKEVLQFCGLPVSGTKPIQYQRLVQFFAMLKTKYSEDSFYRKCRQKTISVWTERFGGTSITPPKEVKSNDRRTPGASTRRPSPGYSTTRHHDVLFRDSPFYVILATLLPPTQIDNLGQEPREHGFALSREHVHRLNQEQTHKVPDDKDSLRILLRVCPLLEGQMDSCPDQFPDLFVTYINNSKETYTIPPTAANQKSAHRKVSDRPKDITSKCVAGLGRNKLKMATTAQLTYLGGVYLALYKPPEMLANEIVRLKTIDKDIAWKRWQASMQSEGLDSEVAATTSKLSLLCPISRMRLTRPARGVACRHLQCFDLLSYLSINERRPAWMCPVCSRPLPFSDIVVDGHYVHVLENTTSEDTEVQLEGATRSWRVPPPKIREGDGGRKRQRSPGMGRDPKQEMEDVKNIIPSSPLSPVGRASKKCKVVVDLTVSSSEEEEVEVEDMEEGGGSGSQSPRSVSTLLEGWEEASVH